MNCVCAVMLLAAAASAADFKLDNGQLSAEFDAAGLVRVTDVTTGQSLDLARDSASLTVNGQKLDVPGLKLTNAKAGRRSVTYTYAAGEQQLQVIYELRQGWHFLSKQLVLTLPPGATCRVDAVETARLELKTRIAAEQQASRSSGAVFLRLAGGDSAVRTGAFFALQNPFLKWAHEGRQVTASYAPEMEWRAAYGAFASDRLCLGIYKLSGIEFPMRDLAEWTYVREPDRAFQGKPMLDLAEFSAVRGCVEAFALYRPNKSLRVHVPWCENDYQIDAGTPAGRTEWKRIIDQCAAIGCDNALFTPAHSDLAPLADNADAWGWENCLWLGLGQKIRKGEWRVGQDPIPASVQEMLDYAKGKKVKLVAYVYPTLGWKQNPEWTVWCGGKTGGYVGVDTGVRSFQDWFVQQLAAFKKQTGIAGYSFDHWFIAYEPKDGTKPTSKYAQWFGCRRILEELRRRIPDVVIDGRQQYQWFGPWTWLGGSYPHPTTNDEQPGSFKNFPDLHFSRVSADRERWAAWYYSGEQFAPLDLVPGYMTHQTPRSNAKGECVRDRAFQARDWDYLGWRYSVISSIGTAPFNHVINLLPARDEIEFLSFKPADQRWLRHWMDWTDQHRDTLRHLRPVIGPPVLGRVDGTAAIVGDHGFVFLFNPNYRELSAEFTLDGALGLTKGEEFLLRELFPRPGLLHGAPQTGLWRRGDKVRLPIKGPQACVLEVVPAGAIKRPVVLNASGAAVLKGDSLSLIQVEGERGSTANVSVLLPREAKVSQLSLNGRSFIDFIQQAGVVTLPVTFAGAPFGHCQQVGTYDPGFAGKTFRASFTMPERVFRQLAERRRAWPVSYTQEELLATWRGSDRLLLYVHIAEPVDTWSVGLKLNGRPVEVRKAYSDVFPLGRERTFTGFYADVSELKPDARYEVELSLPDNLKPGQFQGLFFENVEAEFTKELAQ